MTEPKNQTGGCQCGFVRYELLAPAQNAHACHCRMCQRATGGLFAALAGVAKPDLKWTHGEVSFYKSSNLATRGFCHKCGTPLTFSFNDPDARIYVTIGSLDAPERILLERQYGIESKLPFVEFCEHLPQEQTGEGQEEFFANLKSNQYID